LGYGSRTIIGLDETSLVVTLDTVVIGLLSAAPGLPGHRLSSFESTLLGNYLG